MQRTDWWLPEVERQGLGGEGGRKVKTSSYKLNCGATKCSMVIVVYETVLHI